MTALDFDTCFEALTDHRPFRWQRRLFARFCEGSLPPGLDLPTGLGKTSVIAVWLLAKASGAFLPCRLVYIVNRRTVVDQATEVVERIRERLRDPNDTRWAMYRKTLEALRSRLRALSASGDGADVLGVSTLRGELADNQEWKADPARPAIVVGTIDMVGSKLLFSGYGDGPYRRAHHAGLIGQDALVVHDEAHLTPAFSDLLRGVADAQEQGRDLRPLQVLELSATLRGGDGRDVLRLEAEDEGDAIVRERLNATKHLRLHEVGERDVVAKLVEFARRYEGTRSRVLVYVRSPQEAQEVANGLKRELGGCADTRVALLTGTIRGYERDRLVTQDPVYQALLDRDVDLEQTVYLVSTSAGEVGIDLDSDHLVCDITTLDGMIQRLGRVNRRGGARRAASVDVVARNEGPERRRGADEFGQAIRATKAVLGRWADESRGVVDVCPGNLRDLVASLDPDEWRTAFSPRPRARPLTDILLDAWSLTSIDEMPGRPEVAGYLHGLTQDPPETYVMWRAEVRRLSEAGTDAVALGDWFGACRPAAREQLRDRTDRVQRCLGQLLASHRKQQADRDFAVVLLDERGRAEWSHLSEITEKGFRLAFRTVVLPAEARGLDGSGMLDGTATEARDDLDVADTRTGDDRRERWLYVRGPADEHYERLVTGERTGRLPAGVRERARIPLREQSEDAEGEGRDLILVASPRRAALEDPEVAGTQQTLQEHATLVAECVQQIAEGLGLRGPIRDALVAAARWHDRGKGRDVWQRYACNEGGAEPLAKSRRYLHPRALCHYRHELGSLLDAEPCEELSDHPERDLILHLVAAHHQWGRPHFEPRSHDETRTTAENTEASLETVRRFGRMQQRFGRWGLAWLESLVRSADMAASRAAGGAALGTDR